MTSNLPPIYRRVVVEMIRGMLAQGRPATFTVRGNCMAPTLQDGDKVRIVPADLDKPRPGEIVSYVDGGTRITTSRVMRVEGAMMITKGDNEDHDDPPVPFGRVLGKVED